MVTKEIIDDKVLYMDLLLLADEQEDMIHRYHAPYCNAQITATVSAHRSAYSNQAV